MDKLVKVEGSTVTILPEVLEEMKRLHQTRVQLEMKEEEIKHALLAAMKQNNVKQFKNNVFTVTYKNPSTRKTFDSKRLKEELPDIYEEFEKETSVKATVLLRYHD